MLFVIGRAQLASQKNEEKKWLFLFSNVCWFLDCFYFIMFVTLKHGRLFIEWVN